ncbi:threonine/serine dehydratase [Hazenella sp. IB182353]|uniref:threonine ammonia-lyase n=1 Tax=Polycladospora coralii TaxID=2771432 RepID=UPI001746E2B4|nr:threonine/serine dehydratase [Polycladospora coralii]MBS7529054.1 threonine/serine dehydratase [Polycladospora coralii]
MRNDIHYHTILEAHERIQSVIHHTPIITSHILDEITNHAVFLKCENFQRGGAFKIRGATNAISQLTKDQKQRGVVACSSGNHAQAVALASRQLGVHAINCMPHDAPLVKKEAVLQYGGEQIFFDRHTENRDTIIEEIAATQGRTIIHPFDDVATIAGQGTVALEMMQDIENLDVIVGPVGGGGLLAGTCLAVHGNNPRLHVIGAEPELADDTFQSFQAGKRIEINPSTTCADGLRATSPGKITFPIIQEHVEQLVTVSEEEIKKALFFAITRLKVVLEPSGAVSLAAVLSGKIPAKYQRVGVILSGGNVDPNQLADLLK